MLERTLSPYSSLMKEMVLHHKPTLLEHRSDCGCSDVSLEASAGKFVRFGRWQQPPPECDLGLTLQRLLTRY